MHVLDRYIGNAVMSSSLIVLGVLLALFSFASFVSELESVGKGSYGVMQAAEYVFLTMPRVAYQVFPIVGLLGAIIGLGMLASHNELVVIRAAGVSLTRIVLSIMKVGLVLVVISMLIGEVIAPMSERYAKNMRTQALAQRFAVMESGLWARDGSTFIHIRDVLTDGELGGISIYELDERQQLHRVTHARSGRYVDDDWVLQEVALSEVSFSGVQTEHLPELKWRSMLQPELIGVVAVKPETLSFTGLMRYIDYLRSNGLSAERYVLALWNKIISPLTTAVMVFLSIPFIFGPLRSVGIGHRIVVGTMVGIGFYLIDQIFNYAGLVFKFNPVVGAVLPTLFFFTVAVFLLRRVR